MGSKNQQKENPVFRIEKLGELFQDFYASWEFNGARLKNLSCVMHDTYISNTEGLDEVSDASFFNMGLIEILRNYKDDMKLQDIGKLFRKHLIRPLKDGNPYIVENMFYTCVANQEDVTIRTEIIDFYRSIENLLNGVKIINGEEVI